MQHNKKFLKDLLFSGNKNILINIKTLIQKVLKNDLLII